MTIAFKRALRWMLAGYLVMAWGILAWLGKTGLSLREDLLQSDANRTLEMTHHLLVERLNSILRNAETDPDLRSSGVSVGFWNVSKAGTLQLGQTALSPQSLLNQEEWLLLERRFPLPVRNEFTEGLMWVETRSGDRFLRYWQYQDAKKLKEVLFPPGLLRIPGRPPYDLFLLDIKGRLIFGSHKSFQPGEPLGHLSVVERAQDPLYDESGRVFTKLSPQDDSREAYYQRLSPSGAVLVAVLPSANQLMEAALPTFYDLALAAVVLPLVILLMVWLTTFRKRLLRRIGAVLQVKARRSPSEHIPYGS